MLGDVSQHLSKYTTTYFFRKMLDLHSQVGCIFYTHLILGWDKFYSSLDVTSEKTFISRWGGCMIYTPLRSVQVSSPYTLNYTL